ncbi:MAG: hypothetical protein J7J25_03950 [Candidatus Omnitrophica bacterium]|nr:hypothetical protein [Candidatus Omnitrophota bacterium]
MKKNVEAASLLIFLTSIFLVPAVLAATYSKKEEIEKKIASIKQREQELNASVREVVLNYRKGALSRSEAKKKIKPYVSESIKLARQTVKLVIDNLDILYNDLVAQDRNYSNLDKKQVEFRIRETYQNLSRPGLEEEALKNILDNTKFP